VQVKADDTTDVTPYLAVLDEVAEFTAGSDMPDVVRAKLCKARAFALRNGTTEEQATALALLRQALTWIRRRGEKEIDSCWWQVKKASAENASGSEGADQSGGEGAIIRLQQRRK
jgi:hypothetical protein